MSLSKTLAVRGGVLGAALLLLGAWAASDAADTPLRTSYGQAVPVGNGTARAFITMSGSTPVEIGVALSEAALSGLPGHHAPGAIEMPDGHSMYEHVLPLPARNPTAFRSVVFGWNPGGHEPPGIWDVPHFDFHFYTITEAERAAIDPARPDFQRRAERLPDPEFIPRGYVLPAPVAVPGMGVHWVDPTAPELNGKGFDKTFLFGSWDGRVIFAEPMITKAFLESKRDFSAPLPIAQKYQRSGYHPTRYSIRWDEAAKEYRISLTGLVPRG